MLFSKSTERTLSCIAEQEFCSSHYVCELADALPRDIILSILEYIEVTIDYNQSYKFFFGYFINDVYRTIDVVFRCVQISDCEGLSVQLNALLPISRKLLSLRISGKESPQLITLAFPKQITLEQIKPSLAERFNDLKNVEVRNCKHAISLLAGIGSNAKELESITMTNPDATMSPHDFVQTFSSTNLKSLVLDQKVLSDAILKHVLDQNKQLHRLTLLGYFIDLNNVSASTEELLVFPPSLESLSIGYRSLKDHRRLPWRFGPNLKELDVSGITINNDFATLAMKNTHLTHLRLHMCDLSDSEAFSTMMGAFNELTKLDVSWSKIVTADNISTICKLPSLTDLSCCNCRITNTIARTLLQKESIRTMNMEENRLDEGLIDDIIACNAKTLRISISKADGRHAFVTKRDGVLCQDSL